MKLRELFEDGRIVKGVNTTVDVGPDEIKTQAAKFGNSVDKDGKPPTLSSKVKGKSTNVLFNLGLSEDKELEEKWSKKYKRSINCNNPKGFSQKAHCAGRKKNEDIDENFADGKKKGKSRPGRVKRAGASCNGSVTQLRKRAKNASGEKAKMYHWCANMKSGRKK